MCFTAIKKKSEKMHESLSERYIFTIDYFHDCKDKMKTDETSRFSRKRLEQIHEKSRTNSWRILLRWPAIVSRRQQQTLFLELQSFTPGNISANAGTLNEFRPIQRILVQDGSWLGAFHESSSKFQIKQATQWRNLENETLKNSLPVILMAEHWPPL